MTYYIKTHLAKMEHVCLPVMARVLRSSLADNAKMLCVGIKVLGGMHVFIVFKKSFEIVTETRHKYTQYY